MATTYPTVAARPAPVKTSGALPWLRRNFFSSIPNTLATFVMLAFVLWLSAKGIRWGITQAVFVPEIGRAHV